MMVNRKLTGLLLIVMMLVAAGCGVVDQARQTLDYATASTDYLQSLDQFGQDVNALAEKAVNDVDARTDLKQKLLDMKEDVVQFGELQAPEYAKDIHNSVVSYNAQLEQGIDKALASIEQGKVAIEETGIPATLNKLNELLNQINQLSP
ncbi:DUF6376 family protein [Paenibacillus sp. GCM10023252]|uniref:DUF6376 family protein n=1 Tax=Paenibacillus sp. GCM10023252 TaxID=3252649 RepID=UPI00361ECC40